MGFKVLVFGASGLMMSHVLPHVMEKYKLEVTAYVRPGSSGIPYLREIGVDLIEGAWDDAALVEKSLQGFDIVWDAGDSHDPALPRLIVPLLAKSKSSPTFIRFSGTGNWVTQTGGNGTSSAKEYDDSSAEDLASMHDEMFNGTGDILTLKALEDGLNVWILCTGGVYGPAKEGIASTGVFVRLYTSNAESLGYTPYIGDGEAHMQLIHIDDVVSSTDIFLDQLLPTVGKPLDANAKPETRFFNAPGYSYTWKHLAQTWSSVFKQNLNKPFQPKQVELSQAGFLHPLINAEMKAKPTKLTKLGWSPKGPSIEQALPAILKAAA